MLEITPLQLVLEETEARVETLEAGRVVEMQETRMMVLHLHLARSLLLAAVKVVQAVETQLDRGAVVTAEPLTKETPEAVAPEVEQKPLARQALVEMDTQKATQCMTGI